MKSGDLIILNAYMHFRTQANMYKVQHLIRLDESEQVMLIKLFGITKGDNVNCMFLTSKGVLYKDKRYFNSYPNRYRIVQ